MTIQNFPKRFIETRRLSFRVSPRNNQENLGLRSPKQLVWKGNGEKGFIAGAKPADFYLIYARTDPKGTLAQGLNCI